MSNLFDNLYEKIQQNSAKRHRAASLLLVLSVFVTSSVVWVLRGTGITMVNDPICEVEEHSHSDTCYNKVLICTETDVAHLHEDLCYEEELICPLEAHIHTPTCFSDQLSQDYILEAELEPEVFIELDSAEVSDSTEAPVPEGEAPDGEENPDPNAEEMVTDEKPPEEEAIEGTNPDELLESEEALIGPMQEHKQEFGASYSEAGLTIVPNYSEEHPNGVVDNRADGIIFHLFDYGTEGLDHGRSDYRNPAYVGINEGRNLQDDILFFSYGTPSGEAEGYVPTKNNYSGDYNADHLVSGNRPVQGIVNPTLSGGFPTVAGSNHSLDYLFNMSGIGDPNGSDPTKVVYQDVGGLLRTDGSKYYFDSNENYAYYDPTTENENRNFVLYSGTFDIQNDDHHTEGGMPYNSSIRNGDLMDDTGHYEATLSPMKIGFFPFDQFNNSKVDPNFNATRIENEDGSYSDQAIYNHHFGMTMTANFVVPKDANGNTNGTYNGQDIVFNYSGDDDMWVFVDDRLVLDIGGIHEPTSGSINFTENTVIVQDNAYGEKDGGNGYRYDQKKVSDMLGISDEEYKAWFTGQPHTIKMFYLERGGCYSNLSMDFNLPTVKTIDVTKNLDQGSGTGYENEIFRYELWTKAYGETEFKRYDGIYYISNEQYRTNDGVFFLKHGQTASFYDGLDTIEQYYVKEVGIDNQLISNVGVSGHDYPITNETEIKSDEYNFSDSSGIIWFQNTIRETYTDLKVQKVWNGGDQSNIEKIQFRLFQSKNGGEKIPVIVQGYRTFAIKKENGQWIEKSFTNLPLEYGRDRYTYTVDEVYVPNGYASSTAPPVMINGVATIVITNTARERAQLHAQKQWYDNRGNPMQSPPVTPIHFRIKRSYHPYTPPQETRFIVQTINESTGMQTGSWTADGVYVGGSVEFSLNILNGIDVRSVTIDGEPVRSTYGIYEAKDIKENSVVTVYYTDKYDDTSKKGEASYILYHSFSGTMQGWEPFGQRIYTDSEGNVTRSVQSTIETNGHASYAKNDGLAIERNYDDIFELAKNQDKNLSGTSGHNSGAQFKIDTNVLKPGTAYSFSIYAKSISGEGVNLNNVGVILKMRYTDVNGNAQYPDIAEIRNFSGNWQQLANTNFTIPTDIDTSKNVHIYVETRSYDDSSSGNVHDFFIDEFVVAPGGTTISVQPVSNSTAYLNLTKGSDTMTVVHSSDFESSLNPWTKYGSDNIQIEQVSDSFVGVGAVHVSNRGDTFHGIQIPTNYNVFEQNKTYSLSAYVKTENQADSTPFKFSLKYYPNNSNRASYHQIGVAYATGANEWTRLSASNFRIPNNINMSEEIALYIESPDNTADFYVDQVVIATGENLDISTDLYSNETKIAEVSSLNFPRERFDGGLGAWQVRGRNGTSANNNTEEIYAGSSSVYITERSEDWHGLQLPITDFEKYKPGTTHNFSIYVRPDAQTTMKMTLSYTPKGSGQTKYVTVAEMPDVPGGQWVQLSNTSYEIPTELDPEKDTILYVEATQANVDFRVDEFVEGPVGRKVTVNPGDGGLQMDTLTVNLNSDTAIPPPPKMSENLKEEYIRGADGNPIEFTLDPNGNWKLGFEMDSRTLSEGEANYGIVDGKHTLYEDSNCIYLYELEEVGVPPGYVVSYEKQGSSSTTEDAPMLIKNTYSAYELPATGGTGTVRFYIIGLFLLGITILYVCYGLKRERRSP